MKKIAILAIFAFAILSVIGFALTGSTESNNAETTDANLASVNSNSEEPQLTNKPVVSSSSGRSSNSGSNSAPAPTQPSANSGYNEDLGRQVCETNGAVDLDYCAKVGWTNYQYGGGAVNAPQTAETISDKDDGRRVCEDSSCRAALVAYCESENPNGNTLYNECIKNGVYYVNPESTGQTIADEPAEETYEECKNRVLRDPNLDDVDDECDHLSSRGTGSI